MKNSRFGVLLFLLASFHLNAEIEGDSIYQLSADWKNQQGQVIQLRSLLGKKQVVAMIYTHCLHTCPLIVSSMQAFKNTLPEDKRDEFGFVLISLTPDLDTPKILKAFATERELDETRWTLLTGKDSDVRTLAMVLGIKYKAMEDNEIAHSNVFSILDEKGRLITQQPGTVSAAKQAASKF